MKKAEIKAMSTEQLREAILDKKGSLQKLKFAHMASPIENPMVIRTTRRLIATLLTELSIKENAAEVK